MNFIQSFKEILEKVDLLNTQTSDFDPKVIKKGAKVEGEHTDNSNAAKTIAKQHVAEFPLEKDDKISSKYYDELDKTEGKLKKGVKKSFKEIVADLDKEQIKENMVAGGVTSVFGPSVVGTANQFSSDSYAKGDARMVVPSATDKKTKKRKVKVIRRTFPKS